jgi:hypothetical protein
VSDEPKSCCQAGGAEASGGCPRGKWCLVSIVLLATLLIVGVLIQAMIKYTTPPALNAERAAFRKKTQVELRAANIEALTTYGWVDQQRGIVRLPIDQAMKITIAEWQDPAAGRAVLLARQTKAAAALPKAPEKPSAFE